MVDGESSAVYKFPLIFNNQQLLIIVYPDREKCPNLHANINCILIDLGNFSK